MTENFNQPVMVKLRRGLPVLLGLMLLGLQAAPAYAQIMRCTDAKTGEVTYTNGRCISGEFIAHASYRVTGNSVATGEAAGVIAALAARRGSLPHEIPWDEAIPLLAAWRS